MSFLDDGMTFMANVFTSSSSFLSFVTFSTKSSSCISKKTDIGEFLITKFTCETIGVPIGIHSLDNATDDKLVTFAATWSIEDMKIVFAIFFALEFKVDSIRERLEALGTDKAFGVPNLSSTIDDLFINSKSFPTSQTSKSVDILSPMSVLLVLMGVVSIWIIFDIAVAVAVHI